MHPLPPIYTHPPHLSFLFIRSAQLNLLAFTLSSANPVELVAWHGRTLSGTQRNGAQPLIASAAKLRALLSFDFRWPTAGLPNHRRSRYKLPDAAKTYPRSASSAPALGTTTSLISKIHQQASPPPPPQPPPPPLPCPSVLRVPPFHHAVADGANPVLW